MALDHPEEDGDAGYSNFVYNMDLKFLELTDRQARFIISGTTPALVNSIRRSLIADVPSMSIDDVNFYNNTSVLFDEMMALRLGLIPVSYTHLRAHETVLDLVCRLLLEKKKK